MSSLLFQTVYHTLVAFPSNTGRLLLQLEIFCLVSHHRVVGLVSSLDQLMSLASNKVYKCLSVWAAVTKYHRLGD